MAAAREEFDGRPTIANFDTPPKRVLDVGCGVYGQWILAAAPTVGWEATRFVGLDLAPVLVPFSTLPHGLCARVQFVQHDFFQPLPFPDDAFDYIRCGGVAADIPGASLFLVSLAHQALSAQATKAAPRQNRDGTRWSKS